MPSMSAVRHCECRHTQTYTVFTTSIASLNAAIAKDTILLDRSEVPVSISFVERPLLEEARARAQYPGVRFLVVPPVGPAVPLSQIQ